MLASPAGGQRPDQANFGAGGTDHASGGD
jgi:hypothetical protein